MQSTLTPKQSDDPHDVLLVPPDIARVAPADDELSNLLHQAARYRSDQQTRAASDLPAGPPVPQVDATFRASAVNDAVVPGKRGSMARQALRGITALLLAVCIGVATFVWRSYGDTAERKIAKWTTQLALTFVPPEKPALPAQPAAPAVAADATNAAPPQPAPPAQSVAEAVAPAATASPDSPQSLASMTRDLASLGQEVEQLKASIEQLKAGQQQMSRDVAKVSEARASDTKASETRASEQNLRPRKPAPPPRSAAAPRRSMSSYSSPQAAVAPAPYYPPRQSDYVPRQAEPQPQFAAEPLTDPELSTVPRPPMPVR
jgi:hypothetical protein